MYMYHSWQGEETHTHNIKRVPETHCMVFAIIYAYFLVQNKNVHCQSFQPQNVNMWKDVSRDKDDEDVYRFNERANSPLLLLPHPHAHTHCLRAHQLQKPPPTIRQNKTKDTAIDASETYFTLEQEIKWLNSNVGYV